MTQSKRMGPTRRQFLVAAATRAAAQKESVEIYRDPPRLLLTGQRLTRLRRERERSTARWQQFALLAGGGARMPEPGFANALYHRITGDEQAARRAVDAVSQGSDVRQIALVFDWCGARAAVLRPRLEAALAKPAARIGVTGVRSRALAAIALGGRAAAAELRRIVEQWWRRETIPALKSGRDALPRGDFYALFELMHAVRDNLQIELRDDFPAFFERVPLFQLLSYYPAIYPAPENDYRIPAVKGAEPDLTAAALARAADLAMVAYDTNLRENLYLQGWAMHERFTMRAPLGAPYEFLWANPYHPGLSYTQLPPEFYDDILGRVFLRSNWQDSAEWLGWFGGELQTFSKGEPRVLPLGSVKRPFRYAGAAVCAPSTLTIPDEVKTVFVLGLQPRHRYEVEPTDREMDEATTDPGGILKLDFPTGFRGALRLRG